MTGDRRSAMGKDFRERDLDRVPTAGKVGVALGQGPQVVHVVGEDGPRADVGRSAAADPPNRIAQCVDPRHQQIRATVERVHREEECSARNSIAAIIRHEGEYGRT